MFFTTMKKELTYIRGKIEYLWEWKAVRRPEILRKWELWNQMSSKTLLSKMVIFKIFHNWHDMGTN